ncbi:hypothetical protein HPB48_021724 [Haemaphysalis longicornis]|uniref:Uncharacterized protein n=1 Tax=Haemaphysalis longicornis TaxID=44386 RepID=A0A9J6FE10_HAELO|nr:hypothetical protein HPB48_021724 [Haemaphysalis longicornis]
MSHQQEHRSETFLSYMERISDLKDDQRFVTVMVDEIYIKSYFDYKRGNITGVALNQNEAANSKKLHTSCQLHKLGVEFLHKTLKDVICGPQEIGYRVVSETRYTYSNAYEITG